MRQRLSATHRQTRDRAVIGVASSRDSSRSTSGITSSSRSCGKRSREHRGLAGNTHQGTDAGALQRVALRHHDDHRHGFALGDHVVEDDVRPAVHHPAVLRLAVAVEQVEHRVAVARTGRSPEACRSTAIASRPSRSIRRAPSARRRAAPPWSRRKPAVAGHLDEAGHRRSGRRRLDRRIGGIRRRRRRGRGSCSSRSPAAAGRR